MSSCKSLPEAVWKLIFNFMSVKERLGVCALVSKTLHRAAVAATDHLKVSLDNFSSEQMECFWGWLDQHGQHVTTLAASGANSLVLSRLPCQNLRQLELSLCRVHLGPSSSQPGLLKLWTALTQLVLIGCSLPGGRTSLTALSAVPALQHLELLDLRHDDSEGPQDADFELPAAVLSCLQQLTCMKLSRPMSPARVCIQHISCLRRLQQLGLEGTEAISPSTIPGMDRLTVLQTLNLCNVTLDPTAFQGCTTLQCMALLSMDCIPGTHSMQPLLDLIAQQQQLEHLVLYKPNQNWPPAPGAYTALSASSKLQRLHLGLCNLPAGAWAQGVFRPGQQLPELEMFLCEHIIGSATALNRQDVAAFVSCCPAVRYVTFPVQPGVQLTGLVQLTALEDLSILQADATSVSSLSALSDLTSLHQLSVAGDTLDTASLLPLTSLKGLTRFCVYGGMKVDYGGMKVDLNSKGPASQPDVWKQLLEHCQAQQPQ